MLGVSGLRGVVGTSLTPDLAARFAATVASWAAARNPPKSARSPRPTIVLARDGRAGGEMLAHAAAAGITAAGCNALDLGVAMTPTAGVAVDAAKAHAGIVITASHNPQQWNGLKILFGPGGSATRASAAAPPKALADEIIARFRSQASPYTTWDRVGDHDADDATRRQFTTAHPQKVHTALADLGVLKAIKKARLTAVLDSVNASGALETDTFIESLGTTVHAVADRQSGLFPHPPEPIAENLTTLGKHVKRAKAHVGFAQDPDADRLALLDERGRFIGEEYTLVLAARALADLGAVNKGDTIAVNLSTSRMIDDLAASRGLTVLRTPVGEANVVEAMKSRRSALGGEGNGGVIWPRITYIRDSLGAIALTLALLATTKRPLSALIAEMPAYAIVKRKVDLAKKEDAQPAVERIAKAYAKHRVDLQDGVRVDFDDRAAWVHVRASNTEPIMRLIAEAPTEAAANGLLDEVAKVAASR
jgi:phosphomannomutase